MKFRNWIDEFNLDEIDLREFNVTDVDFFGPILPNKLGFVKGYGVAFDKATGEAIPAIAFIRGNSIAVLIVVKVRETGKLHVLMCKQLRFPAGKSLIEACAGMIDDKTKNVVGVVFNEVKQETGFIIQQDELIELGSIRPSGGGCDEVIHLYAWETEISQNEYDEKLVNVYGEGAYEKIKLIFYDFETFDDILDQVGDVKAECCWRRYLRSDRSKFKLRPVSS
jgi:ADP-sugar diphosphatase